jgi:hypothetical protein
MFSQMDIFKLEKDGSLVWKKTADNLEVAKVTVRILADTTPGDYVIFSPRSGSKITIKASSPQ